MTVQAVNGVPLVSTACITVNIFLAADMSAFLMPNSFALRLKYEVIEESQKRMWLRVMRSMTERIMGSPFFVILP